MNHRTLAKLSATALAIASAGLFAAKAHGDDASTANTPTADIASVYAAEQAFEKTLSPSQLSTYDVAFTTTNAAKWSNLPVGAASRNGLRLDSLTTAQQTAALNLARVALGSAGYDRLNQIRLADDYLSANGGGNAYGSGLYFVAALGTPNADGSQGNWMLQFGGHHIAYNVTYNTAKVSSTPFFIGVEPQSFTTSGTTYTPLESKRLAVYNLLNSLSTAQLTGAKLTSSFSDVYLGPGKDKKSYFPTGTTGRGILYSSLTSAQQALVKAVIASWTGDVPAGSTFQTLYERGLSQTYVAYSGSDTTLNTQGDYVRIDGPRVWIEFACQNGIVFQNKIHFHTVMRDKVTDYGNDLTF